jgi:hypothetical protein
MSTVGLTFPAARPAEGGDAGLPEAPGQGPEARLSGPARGPLYALSRPARLPGDAALSGRAEEVDDPERLAAAVKPLDHVPEGRWHLSAPTSPRC